jgi:hypothetical protein
MVCSAIGVTTGVAAVITIAKPFAQTSNATGSAVQSVEEFIIVLFIEEQLLDIGEDDTTSTDDVILKTTILRSKLADKLPAAFVPAVILPVKQIPRTTAGKIDRPQLLKVFSSSVVDGTNETDAVKGASAVGSEDVLDVTNIDQAEDSLPSVMFSIVQLHQPLLSDVCGIRASPVARVRRSYLTEFAAVPYSRFRY